MSAHSESPGSAAVTDTEARERTWPSYFVLVLLFVPVYVLGASLVIRAGLFNFASDAPLSAEEGRAVWGFLGAATAAAVSATGLLLTRSHNLRSLRLQRGVEQAKARQQEEADTRLKLDTAVGGIKLIGDSGRYAPPAQIAGALAILVHLGHPVIALRCLAAAWPHRGDIDTKTAVWTIESAFHSGGAAAQYEAVHLARTNLDAVIPRDSATMWEPCFSSTKWSNVLLLETRAEVVRYYLQMPLQRPRTDEWSTSICDYLIEPLFNILTLDANPLVRKPVAEALHLCLTALRLDNSEQYELSGETVVVADLQAAVEQGRQSERGLAGLWKPLWEFKAWLESTGSEEKAEPPLDEGPSYASRRGALPHEPSAAAAVTS